HCRAVGHAPAVAGPADDVRQSLSGGELGVPAQVAFNAGMELLAIEAIDNGYASEHCAGQSRRLDLLVLLDGQQLDGLVPQLDRLDRELFERNAAVAPAADGLLDIAFGLI